MRPRVRRFEHRARFHAPACSVVAIGAGRGPCAPADHGGDAVRERLVDLLRRDEVDVAVDAAGVTIRFSPAMTSVEAPTTRSGSPASMVSGLPSLAHLDDFRPSRTTNVALDDAPVIGDQSNS
jgi:hypothetical protein